MNEERETTINTPLGRVRIVCHNRDSFYLGAGTRYDTGAEEPLMINNVPYQVNGQIAFIDGAWNWNGGGYSKGPTLSRAGSFKAFDYTTAAGKKACAVLLKAATEWAQGPGRDTLTAGENHDITQTMERYRETLAALELALSETKEAIQDWQELSVKPAQYPKWRVEERKS